MAVYVEEDAVRFIANKVVLSMTEDFIRSVMQHWWSNQERFKEEAPIDPQSGLPWLHDPVELIIRELPHAGRCEISQILDAELEYLRSIGLVE
jgi:hypothetical protein